MQYAISSLLGPTDANQALVLAVIAITICVMVTASIVKRRSNKVLDQEHELAKIKEKNSADLALKQLSDSTSIKQRQIDADADIERAKLHQANMLTAYTTDRPAPKIAPGIEH